MSPYANKKPRFVREWYLKLKARLKEIKAKMDEEEQARLQVLEQEDVGIQQKTSIKYSNAQKPKKEEAPLLMKTEKHGDGDFDQPLAYFDGEDDDQQNWEDELAQQIEFSDDEDPENENGMGMKNANYSMMPPNLAKKEGGRISNKVDETKYQKSIEKLGPDFEKYANLERKYQMYKNKHQKWKDEQRKQFMTNE